MPPLFTTHPSPTSDPRYLQFTLHNTPTYFANALRRIMIADLQGPGIANAYAHKRNKHRTRLGSSAAEVTDTDGSTVRAAGSGIHILTNTGRINNEMLRLRFALLPLALNPTALNTPDGGKMVLRLNKRCPADAEAPIVVTSEDIVLVKRGGDDTVKTDGDVGVDVEEESNKDDDAYTPVSSNDLAQYLLPDATQLIPTDPLVTQQLETIQKSQKNKAKHRSLPPEGILLTRLYPDEALVVDMYPGVGCSRDFAGFSPLHTCTYQQQPAASTASSSSSVSGHPNLHDFRFTIQSLGASSPTTLVRDGLHELSRKVIRFREVLMPNTIELEFGPTAYPSLHTILSSSTRTCWVKWSDVDFLTRLQAPEAFYRRHCHDVLAVTTPEDLPLTTTPFPPSERVPSVDGEDIVESTEHTKHILALHQPAFAENGVYEYHPSTRTYTYAPQAHTTFLIAKDGRTQRAKVFTQAELVHVHGTRCVLRFNEAITPTVMEHIRSHMDALVCPGATLSKNDASPSVTPSITLQAPRSVRPEITTHVSDNGCVHTFTVPQEDHTLGNLVQGWVYDRFLRTDKHQLPQAFTQVTNASTSSTSPTTSSSHPLIAIGYKQPLPSERTIVFRVEFGKGVSEEESRRVLGDWVEGVGGMVEEVVKGWDK